MNDDLRNIDDLFKKALEEHTEIPSSAVWDNIDKSLDKKKVVSLSKKYNKLKWAAAVLLLFSFGMAMYTVHIRIKNKELVKQHNAGKNLENQKTHTKNSPEDSSNLSQKNNNGIEKGKVNRGLNKQEKHNNTRVISSNKIDLPQDKNTADNVNQRNIQIPDNTQIKLPPEEKTGENITNQNKKQLLLKNKSAIKMQGQSAGIDSGNNRKKNPVRSMVSNNDKIIDVNKEQQEKLNDNSVSPKEKHVNQIQLISQLKDMLQILVTKPVSQIPKIPANNTVALKDNKTIPVKHDKTVRLKQRNMKNGNSPLSAIIFFSPDLVSTNVKNDHPLFREEDRHEIEKDEKIKSSSTMGVLIDYNTGKNWILESGVIFSAKFTDIQPKTIYARPDNSGNINYRFNCSSGYSFVTLKPSSLPPAYGDSIRALTSKNILQYIGVPLVVKYMFGKGRFSLTPGVGITANFLTGGKIETTIPTTTGNESVTSNDIRGLKSMYFNGSASVGAQYKINKTFELTLIPTVRFALSSINKDAPVKTYLNSIGLAGGIIIKL
jgi:hypothetical protein